jgi:hypothetical protein
MLVYSPAMSASADARPRRLLPLLKVALVCFCLMAPALSLAQTLSGTIQDSSGAVIVGACIEITGGGLVQPIVLSSDRLGKFASPDLKPGAYSLRVTHDGFEPLLKTVDLQASLQLQLTLAVAQQQVTISVPANSLAFLNSDPVYRQLRRSASVKPFTLRISRFATPRPSSFRKAL